MTQLKGYLLCVCLYFCIILNTSTNAAKIIYSKVECINEDPDFFATVNCNLTAEDVPRCNFNFLPRFDMIDPMFDMSLSAVFYKTSHLPNDVLNVTRNFCKLLGYSKSPIIWETLVKEAFQSGRTNIPTKCPWKKDTLYRVDKHLTTASIIPKWVPDATFVLKMRLRKKGRQGALLILSGNYFNK